jgi:hypothetical protein
MTSWNTKSLPDRATSHHAGRSNKKRVGAQLTLLCSLAAGDRTALDSFAAANGLLAAIGIFARRGLG